MPGVLVVDISGRMVVPVIQVRNKMSVLELATELKL